MMRADESLLRIHRVPTEATDVTDDIYMFALTSAASTRRPTPLSVGNIGTIGVGKDDTIADAADDTHDLLAIRVMGRPLALRIEAIAGVARLTDARRVVRLPGSDPSLLGLVAVRGVVLPLYSLADLLGYEGPRTHGWFAWTKGACPAAYAFDGIDGRGWLDAEAARVADADHPLLHGAASFGGARRPLVHLPSALRAYVPARQAPKAA